MRVLLCSDEPILFRGLEAALQQVEDCVILSACTLDTVAERRADADVLLLDLTEQITFDLLCRLRASWPRIILWVRDISTEFAFQAMGLGVRGILRKMLPIDLQVKCLRKVHDGELWFEKALTDSFLFARRVALTKRESELVNLLARGHSNKQLAAIMQISEGTTKIYLSRLFGKLGVRDRFELALFALRNLTPNGVPPLVAPMDPHSGAPRTLVMPRVAA